MSNQDFYFENNCIVLTESFLKRRGFCCKNNCRHCPYKDSKLMIKYILKTNNDLQFDFNYGDLITIKPYVNMIDYKVPIILPGPIKIEVLENWKQGFFAIIGDEEYLITSITKIKE